ncbi:MULTISPECIES: FAD-dependent oxidoreductase [unclassified Rhizobium]|uniref:NAD(P)/FAD-dependent oxidoreductase n=1 Tax=unclassified Rhizobium TaxID=2613769 RepID=UPI0006F24674|nr:MULTISPECIES: FAD-dependent oxidoreductase [unclassified Rhizobium]KQV38214.1 D-amino acid oxidase [Rhizobium sp. Root1212]KRD30871.1 D-amino acid oxidase [Rhizobium sp. Root268]
MTDVLIVGGGIMGLWAAVKAVRSGISVHLVERERIGAGASGGLLGALMPHMPDRWNAKKQFQYEALVSLESEIARLEAETGLSAGYRRCGRIMPLPKPHLRDIALRHEQEALTNWNQQDRSFFWNVMECPQISGWPADEFTASGIVFDTLAARVSPRLLLAVLKAWLGRQQNVILDEGCDAVDIDPQTGRACLSNGLTVSFGACLLANGVGAFDVLDRLNGGSLKQPIGVPVKGQAALLDAKVDPTWPVIFHDGLYIIPHEDGRVAVGSTSEERFDDPVSIDDQLDGLITRARRFAPCLELAPVVERWAGLRPKAIGRDPIAGRHPEHEKLVVLGGGFKISFGIAHRLAEGVVAGIAGGAETLPSSFTVAHHLALQG